MIGNQFAELSSKEMWRLLCDAARRGLESGGYTLARVPGRGLSNLWLYERNGKRGSASIRTTRDRSHWSAADWTDSRLQRANWRAVWQVIARRPVAGVPMSTSWTALTSIRASITGQDRVQISR